jgi:integrase/recombinase XerD
VRDWINKHPFKNEPNARLICNLYNGAPIRSDTIWQVLDQLRDRIKRLVESGSIDEQKKQKLEHLLRTKKWNPYCFRHSAITDDSDHLPEYALKKKVRWVMNSQQGNRYIKNRMGNSLKNEILEHHGIRIVNKQTQSVSRTCGRCNYVNRLENKYCERTGCNYPLTQEAFDQIKSQEQLKMRQLIDKSNLERDNTIQALQQELKSWEGIAEKMKVYVDRQKKKEESLEASMKRYMDERLWYASRYGLSEPYRKKRVRRQIIGSA